MTASLEKIRARMDKIDAMPKEIRELIHEEGLTVVQAFLDQGIKKAANIRHLIARVRGGSIDAAGVSSYQSGKAMCVIPIEPTPDMIEASMAEVSGGNVIVEKYEKHRLRLRAAIRVGISRRI